MQHEGLPPGLSAILSISRTQVVFGAGALARIGALCAAHGASRVLLVTDRGIVAAGHAHRAQAFLQQAGLHIAVFDAVAENPTTDHVDRGVKLAREAGIDFIVGLGGGSALDCAKGVNFILTNGGRMQDYWGVGKATQLMLPSIGIPTTAGTGSEAQSFALITDPVTHQKMACGDEKAAFRVAILDPELTRTCPRAVAAATGIDAISHAIETAATKRRNENSAALSREAWTLLDRSFERSLHNSADDEARADMLLGAHLAGAAIEQSMLGAAHACANPLTSQFGVTHGLAIGVMLPPVIRFNSRKANFYSALDADAEHLAQRVEQLRSAAGLPSCLREVNVAESVLPSLAEQAARQWTAGFNPVSVGVGELLEIYSRAFSE
jgi:alcohol dehydrogenase